MSRINRPVNGLILGLVGLAIAIILWGCAKQTAPTIMLRADNPVVVRTCLELTISAELKDQEGINSVRHQFEDMIPELMSRKDDLREVSLILELPPGHRMVISYPSMSTFVDKTGAR